MNLSDLVCMVGDDREIQRAMQGDVAMGVAIGVEGLDSQRAAPGKLIGLAGRRAGVLGARVLRMGGVDVGVTEKGSAERRVVRAGLSLFRDRVGSDRLMLLFCPVYPVCPV